MGDADVGAVVVANFIVALIGEWLTLREPHQLLVDHLGLVVRFPRDPGGLRNLAIQFSPTWLVLGEGVNDERLALLANLVQIAVPTVRLMVLGRTNDVDRYDRWLARGASAYLRATIQPAEALRVAQIADEVDVAIIDAAFPRLRAARRAQLRPDFLSKPSALTRREREVLHLLRLGMRNSAIGHALKITESTTEFHVSNILGKLEAATRTEAVERAHALGL